MTNCALSEMSPESLNGNGDLGIECEACLQRINGASGSQFEAVSGIGPVKASDLVAAQPFEVTSCSVSAIEAALDAVYGIGEVLRERIVRYFCPELYE